MAKQIRRRPSDPDKHLRGEPIKGDPLTSTEARDEWASVKTARKTEQQSELAFCRRLAAFYDRHGPKAMGWARDDGSSPVPYMAKVLGMSTGQIYRKINSGRMADFLVAHGQHVSGLAERTLREAIPLMDKPEVILKAAEEASVVSQKQAQQAAARGNKTPPRRVDTDPKVFKRIVRDHLPKPPPESMGQRRLRAIDMMVSGLDRCSEGCTMVGGDDLLRNLLDECRVRVEEISKT
jgi:hypothetical protein